MAERRKRRRPVNHSTGDSTEDRSNRSQIEVGESSAMAAAQNGQLVNATCTVHDMGSSVSKCSVRLINEVVSRFNEQKRDLVKSIGFEGILYFPHIKQFNRKFTLWLMSCVNERMATINISTEVCISFNKYDVGKVLGIPAEGKAVLEPVAASRDAKGKVIQHYLGSEFKELRSIKIAQEIVERDYGVNIGKEDADRFRVAFIVFVVSNLLSPSAKHDYASVDYWNAIENPDAISAYDWSDFVFVKLLEGVTKLKHDMANNIKFPNITGCSIFLQVIYLDSLHLEGLFMPHTTLPRVRDFTFDKIRAMILADQNYSRHIKADSVMSGAKLRNPSGCIYSWAFQMRQPDAESRTASLLATWESALALVHLLNIPLEAAGPLFVAVVKFQEQVNSGLFFNGTQATRLLNAIACLLMPYTRGFSYQPSYGSSSIENGYSVVQSAISNGTGLLSYPIRNSGDEGNCQMRASSSNEISKSLNDECQICACHTEITPCSLTCYFVQPVFYPASTRTDEAANSLSVNELVASIMAQFYSIFRKLKPSNDFDLNAADCSSIASPSASSTPASEVCAVLSPWQLGYAWCDSENITDVTVDKISRLSRDDSLAIVHRKPKYIQVSMSALASQFVGKSEMELDLFDALVRTVRQQDDLLFSSFGSLRWRHYFESDFMSVILSGAVDLVDPSLRQHLCLSDTSYDLAKSQLVFFPALLQSHWVCFVWQPHKNVICVFDPGYCSNVPDRRVQLIERSCYMLKLALKTLSTTTFLGFSRDVTSADVCIMNLADHSVSRINWSGVLCSLFYRCFDGADLIPSFAKVHVQNVAAKLLYQLRDLKENSGTLDGFFGSI